MIDTCEVSNLRGFKPAAMFSIILFIIITSGLKILPNTVDKTLNNISSKRFFSPVLLEVQFFCCIQTTLDHFFLHAGIMSHLPKRLFFAAGRTVTDDPVTERAGGTITETRRHVSGTVHRTGR